jgi:hypothetical protein
MEQSSILDKKNGEMEKIITYELENTDLLQEWLTQNLRKDQQLVISFLSNPMNWSEKQLTTMKEGC